MDALTLIILAFALAMDALAVSLCKGLAMRDPTPRSILIVGLWFGGFQALMPVIGYLLGRSFYEYISAYDHWVAFILLAIIGINMIRESFSGEEEGIDDSIGFKTMLILAIATSIDALAVGISLAMDDTDITVATIVIGSITLAISAIGVKIGSLIGSKYGPRAEFVGGIALILIGLKIVAEHFELF